MIFRGKFRSRILILCVVALVVLFQLDNINTVISDFIADNEQHEPALEQERQPEVNVNQPPIRSDLEQLDTLLGEYVRKARHNPDMNNKNPKWRQELNDIADEVARLQDRVHHAVADNQPDQPISSKPSQQQRHGDVILIPYDHTQGAPKDAEIAQKRDQVRDMMRHAWRGYKERAWTENEVRPISGRGHSANIFGNGKTGATIVDALDTLWIMGLTDEFNEGMKWVKEKFVFNSNADVSVFETVIRFVGGFIAAGTMSGQAVFYEKAIEIVDILDGAFDTKSGIPMALFNPTTKRKKNFSWASSGCSILAEIGTLHLEYSELSHYSGNGHYLERVMNIRNILQGMPRSDGLYPNYINPQTLKWGQKHVSVGGLGDSFYEYLIKTYVYTNGVDHTALEIYKDALSAIEKKLIKTSPGGLTYIGELKSGRVTQTMAHLTCFAGGMIALGAQRDHSLDQAEKERQMKLAEEVTRSCHESYDRTATKLGPESFRFDLGGDKEATQSRSNDAYYILRPEVIESYFYMWRYTKKQQYRDWAWEAVQALERHCKAAWGYTGLKNVNSNPPQKDDLQQSFFLAETLKYLYLIFSDDELISLDEFVFNTEAHPIRIQK